MTLSQKILLRMAELGIKSNVELANRMKKVGVPIHPNTIGKWIAEKTKPRGTSLIGLAKALETTLDDLLLDDNQSAEHSEELRRVVTDVAREEIGKLMKDAKGKLKEELVLFLDSDKIPQEDKEALIRQARNLLKFYEKIE